MQKLWKTCTLWGLMIASPAIVAAEDLLLGFQIDGTLAQAQKHAASNDWKLRPLSAELPNEWVIDAADAGLFICEGRVLAVRRTFEGGVDEFAIMVFDAMIERGEPETSIISFQSGGTRISNIDARYEADDGSGAAIQLSSTGGEVAISTNVWSGIKCAN